jgi:hypothetical protein
LPQTTEKASSTDRGGCGEIRPRRRRAAGTAEQTRSVGRGEDEEESVERGGDEERGPSRKRGVGADEVDGPPAPCFLRGPRSLCPPHSTLCSLSSPRTALLVSSAVPTVLLLRGPISSHPPWSELITFFWSLARRTPQRTTKKAVLLSPHPLHL